MNIAHQFTCSNNLQFFETSKICGTCSTNRVYDQIQRRCSCNPGYFEDPNQAGQCQLCGSGNAPAGSQYCRTGSTFDITHYGAASSATAEQKMIPCIPGYSLFLNVINGNFECVVDTMIDYNPLNTSDPTNAAYLSKLCGALQSWSSEYEICYITLKNQPPAQDPKMDDVTYTKLKYMYEAYACCATGVSARACTALYNWCIWDYNFTSTACNFYDSLFTILPSDIIEKITLTAITVPYITNFVSQDPTQSYTTLVGNTPQLYVEVSDDFGNIIYNSNAFQGSYSMCAFIRSQQSFEEQYLYKGVNKKYTKLYGFSNRTQKSNQFQRNNYQHATDQQSFFNALQEYEEKCSFPDIINNLFLEYYIKTVDGTVMRVPQYASSTDASFDAVKTNTTSKISFLRADSTYLSKLELVFGYDVTAQQIKAPYILTEYSKLVSTELKQYVSDISKLAGNIGVAHHSNIFDFKVTQSIATTTPMNTVLIFSIIMGILGFFAGLIYNCKAGGDFPVSINGIMKIKYKEVAGEIQETKYKSWWHILASLSYIIGYIGIGIHFSYVLSMFITLFMRSSILTQKIASITLKSTIASFIMYLFFFGIKIFEKSNQKIIIFDSNNSSDTKNSFKPQLFTNMIYELSKDRPGNLRFAVVLSYILITVNDYIYMATPSENWQWFPTSNKYQLEPLIYLCIFNIIYAITMLIKLLLNYFYPSPFLKFQQFCYATNTSIVINDTSCSLLLIKGNSAVNGQDHLTIVNAGQKITTRNYVPPANSIQRVYFNQTDADFFQVTELLDCLSASHKLLKKQKLFKLKRFHQKQIENYDSILGMISLLPDRATSSTLPGWPPWLLFDVKTSKTQQSTSFERPHNENNWFLRNPMFKSVFLYNMWFYELLVFGITCMMMSIIVQNVTIGVASAFLIIEIVWYFERLLVARSLERCNLVQEQFVRGI
ncbi:Transmembrane_domain-containing protein [Hexamita inflata]|uniref:Transmembrane domain-containing protein n=1 Tax=Hexamita inflata TaxID=28002 RepID=A0AA86PUQ3_9EUKA|nr:Transmembrane domain-containing protein [Hexamita inflata]